MQLMRHLRMIGVLAAALAVVVQQAALAQYEPRYAQQQPMQQQQQYGGQMATNGYGGMPPTGMGTYPAVAPVPTQAPGPTLTIAQWFQRYDQIRREAQMSPTERQQADTLLSRGISILVPGQQKLETKALLSNMVGRYQRACMQLKQLPQIQPTQQLHLSYFNYFSNAGNLFNDYLRVQDNLFLTDATTGQPVAASLLQRKQMLEALETRCKQVDSATRAQFGVPPYKY